jgi:hypothetical protein
MKRSRFWAKELFCARHCRHARLPRTNVARELRDETEHPAA